MALNVLLECKTTSAFINAANHTAFPCNLMEKFIRDIVLGVLTLRKVVERQEKIIRSVVKSYCLYTTYLLVLGMHRSKQKRAG